MLSLSLFFTKFKAENALSTLAVATGSNYTNFKSADSAPTVAAMHSAATVAGCAATAGMALQLPPTPIRTPFRGSVKSTARASSQVPAAA